MNVIVGIVAGTGVLCLIVSGAPIIAVGLLTPVIILGSVLLVQAIGTVRWMR